MLAPHKRPREAIGRELAGGYRSGARRAFVLPLPGNSIILAICPHKADDMISLASNPWATPRPPPPDTTPRADRAYFVAAPGAVLGRDFDPLSNTVTDGETEARRAQPEVLCAHGAATFGA